jgi:type I restriction enzyme R subunit
MNKRDLTEQEIRSRYIRPALIDAGWEQSQIREEYYFTAGRMHISGQTAVRGKRKFVDYLLIYKNVPLAKLRRNRWLTTGTVISYGSPQKI